MAPPKRFSTTQDLRALAEAGVALSSELSLPVVLQKLVDLAREQVDARYGALSVLGPDGDIEQFLTSGISEEERQRIGDLPRGRGLLGVLLREGASLRMEDMASDPRSAGFPPHHPPMRSLLGMPVTWGKRIIGNLYLTEKQGATGFDERDEEVLRLLATQAAVAVRNAELYAEEHHRAEEWKALFDLSRQLTASRDSQEFLQSTVERARSLLRTDMACIMLLRSDGQLHLAASEGLQTTAMGDLRLLSEHGLQGLALSGGKPVVVTDYESNERLHRRPAKLVDEEGLASLICAPLPGKEGPLGTITAGNRHRTGFSERDGELVESLANLAAVSIETSRLYEKLDSLARLEERERIGMDLHDGVIQSIYAVGLTVEDCMDRLDEPPEQVRPVLEKTLQDLHQVIKDIRSYIFDLRPQISQVTDLPDAIRKLVEDVRVNTLMEVEMEARPLDGAHLGSQQALALFHIAQEALNNVAKHSRATSARVFLGLEKAHIKLEVADNGVGFEVREDESGQRHGLRNIKDRARSVGAEVSCQSAPGKGTTITVELPVQKAG